MSATIVDPSPEESNRTACIFPIAGKAPLLTTDDFHVSKSTTMIREAASMARPGRVALLGCGSCAEIPLEFLGQRFEHLDLVDLNGDALQLAALAASQFDLNRHNYAFHIRDLTGLKKRLEDEAEAAVAQEPTAMACMDRLAEALGSIPPSFWRPKDGARYDFIVCSGVLTQLQAKIRESVEDIFLRRHANGHGLLCSHKLWTRNVWRFARALEHAFIDHLQTLARPGGIVYLADTVYVSWLRQVDSTTLSTPGAWIATETHRLEDYLDERLDVRVRDHWTWFRKAQEGDFWGRLYGVQALVCQTRLASGSETSVEWTRSVAGALGKKRGALHKA